ncbi:MAG: sulfurtransferase [Bacteroidetes bacterium]|nr:MAG: sulfurtransferase [Bacteroidota bacterium]
MGPLTYFGEISTEWNYVIAVFIGMAFGYIMEASGFSSSRKLIGVFYGYDFAVIRVFITATLVAIIGLLYMGYFGLIDYSVLFVHPTFVYSAIIGGVIMGFGFITGGFCPGTSLCAVAIGKLDGWVFTGALFLGIMVYSWVFPLLEPWYNLGDMGHIKITEWLGVSEGWFVFGFAVVSIAIFYITALIRRKIKHVRY